MDVITVNPDEEIINAFKHFDEWVSLSGIAAAIFTG